VEVLATGRPMYSSPEPTSMLDEGLRGAHAGQVSAYPQPSFRTSKHTIASISNSSGVAQSIETPPIPLNATPFFAYGTSSPVVNSSPASNASPNRFKNLPPLPPNEATYSTSPDSFRIKAEQPDFTLRSSYNNHLTAPYPPTRPGDTFRGDGFIHQQPIQGSPRTSFDPYGDRPATRAGEMSPRLAQSMYVQPTASGSTGSFGRFTTRRDSGGMRKGHGKENVVDLSDNRRSTASTASRKGLLGLFGGARNGRMA